jgi:hypothetical protein
MCQVSLQTESRLPKVVKIVLHILFMKIAFGFGITSAYLFVPCPIRTALFIVQ